MSWVILNGQLAEKNEATLPIQSRPVAYGDGCFETMRSYSGKFLAFEDHIDRLHSSMDYLLMDVPPGLGESEISDQIHRLLEKNELSDQQASVRIQVWREGPLGFQPSRDAGVGWLINANAWSIPTSTQTLVEVPTRRIPSQSLMSSYKLSNSINYIHASLEARELGADDALMLTTEDYISETPIANIFWIVEQKFYTPNLECDILPGITRAIVSHIVRDQSDFNLVKGRFSMEDLLQADAVFICNSLRELIPVEQVNETAFDTEHETLAMLEEAFETYKDEHLISLR